jgi:hypothetical protein
MKTAKTILSCIKDSDGWMSLAHELKFEQFKSCNPELSEEDVSEKFYTEVVCKMFEYGEYANIELEIDENFNIVGGRIMPNE